MTLTIQTNHQPRGLKYLSDFNSADQQQIRSQYDWMDKYDLECNYGFFKYRGCFYHLQDFLRVVNMSTDSLIGWDGYLSDSFFSGVVIKLVDNDCDSVIIGRFCC
jgi:hypothetical protein